jgi:putative transposase
MARPQRICYPGAVYHVMSRGNRKGKIFITDADRLHFLELLDKAHRRYHVRWRAFSLMKTHYHLEAETPLANLSEVMRLVNGQFAQAWNRRHRKTGHVFAGRFKAKPIEDDFYSQTALRYIIWNPVEAGYVKHPAHWPWSSYRATAGLEAPPDFLNLRWLQGFFGRPTRKAAQKEFVEFIDAGPVDDDYARQIVVGSKTFKEQVRRQIGAKMHGLRVPRSYRALARPSLGKLFTGLLDDLEGRNRMILRAQVVYGYRQSEIARSLNLHPNSVSKITRAIKGQRFFLVNVD